MWRTSIFGQTDAEDIILVYDSLNPNGKVVLKSELLYNLDSLSLFLVDDVRDELMTKMDSTTIRNFLIGSWTLESVKRINEKPYSLQVDEKMQFHEDGNFVIINTGNTSIGTWTVMMKNNGNLHLSYDEPQISIKDKEILNLLTAEQIKSMTFSSSIEFIKQVDSKTLVLMTFVPENPKHSGDVDDMFFRLILATYKKND